ncbi:reticulon-1 isoform X4 [Nasonia vitripennis]|nr:reticulon-1 isoform X4 [Nasonia vitripennis]
MFGLQRDAADNDSADEDDNTEPERSEPSEPILRAPPAPAASDAAKKADSNLLDDDDMFAHEELSSLKEREQPPSSLYAFEKDDFMGEIKSSTLPEPEKSPELDFVKDEIIVHEATKEKPKKPEDELWNVLEKSGNDRFEEREVLHDEPPTKPLPPLPKGAEHDAFDDFEKDKGHDKFEMSNEFLLAESKSNKAQLSGGETGDSEFESEPEPSPAKTAPKPAPARAELGDAAERKFFCQKPNKNRDIDEIAPKEIWRHIGIDAWFNPERLNPKVAALIYWRDPKKSGIVFGATLGVLLSLAYFSLISVLAYISLLTLTFTVAFRIYKTVLQAIQKTSDGHPFKDILEIDLTLPAEKVHEVADIAVANANAAVSELRRLFLVEDIVDSLKFGIVLWSLTYLGAWFNGMTLIIIGVVALFSLPKVYETNKTQIDQNLALVQAKLNEITAKVKAAMPLGKKAEPAKEE